MTSIPKEATVHNEFRPPWAFRRICPWLLWLLFLCAVAIRVCGLGAIPKPHETNDEYFYLWTGMSLLEGDSPTGWSMLDRKTSHHYGIYRDNGELPIVRPTFDHPPVFSLMTGIAGYLSGAYPVTQNFESVDPRAHLWEVSLWKLRVLPLLLFTASFWLLWKLLRLTTGPTAALTALAMFSFIHTIVMHQRLVIADNFITPCLIAIFLTLEKWRLGQISNKNSGIIVSILIGLAGGSKLVALSMVPAVFAWAATRTRGRQALLPCLWATFGFLLVLVITLSFALVYGLSEFIATTQAQSIRFYDLGGLYDLVRHHPLIHEETFHPLLIGGWLLAFAGITASSSTQRGFFVAMTGYIFGYTFFAPVDVYGWYILPFFPFLCAAWGLGFRAVIARPSSPLAMVTLLLLATASVTPFLESSPALRSPVRMIFAVIALLTLAPWGFTLDIVRKALLPRIGIALMIIIIVGESLRVLSIQAGQAAIQ